MAAGRGRIYVTGELVWTHRCYAHDYQALDERWRRDALPAAIEYLTGEVCPLRQCVVAISGNAVLDASLVVNELTIAGNSDDNAS